MDCAQLTAGAGESLGELAAWVSAGVRRTSWMKSATCSGLRHRTGSAMLMSTPMASITASPPFISTMDLVVFWISFATYKKLYWCLRGYGNIAEVPGIASGTA
jgi:hypothetical protein